MADDLEKEVNRCMGYSLEGSALFNYWAATDCQQTLIRYANDSNGLVQPNPGNLSLLQVKMANLFNNYLRTNSLQEPADNAFQTQLLQTCLDPALYGVCIPFLQDYCPRIPDNQAPSFCACFNLGSPHEGIPTSCEPRCHRAGVVQSSEPCPSNICVISNVNTAGDLKGKVNILNICPDCGPEKLCTCILEVPAYQLGLGTQFYQYCGENAVCYQNGEKVPCTTLPNISDFYSLNIGWIIFFLVIFLLFALYLVLRKSTPSQFPG